MDLHGRSAGHAKPERHGLYRAPEGTERGNLKAFLTGVVGAETTSGTFSSDNEVLFVAIQHPGEGGILKKPVSRWPDGTDMPRPSVVVWKAEAGEKRIGS